MARHCTVCDHPKVEEINRALVAGEAYRNVSLRFDTSVMALCRHKQQHLPDLLAKAQAEREAAQGEALLDQVEQQEQKEQAHAIDVMAELSRCLDRVNKLFDACDEWLRDPEDPDRYTVEPRSEEVRVIYTEDEDGRQVRKKARLSELLDRLNGHYNLWTVETKHADPRGLVLKTAERLQGHLQLVAMLLGKLQVSPTVNILLAPEWLSTRSLLLDTLAPYPEARVAVAERLAGLENGNGHRG
jgi:hypothetical protein